MRTIFVRVFFAFVGFPKLPSDRNRSECDGVRSAKHSKLLDVARAAILPPDLP